MTQDASHCTMLPVVQYVRTSRKAKAKASRMVPVYRNPLDWMLHSNLKRPYPDDMMVNIGEASKIAMNMLRDLLFSVQTCSWYMTSLNSNHCKNCAQNIGQEGERYMIHIYTYYVYCIHYLFLSPPLCIHIYNMCVCVCNAVSIYLFVCLSVDVFIYLFAYLTICLSTAYEVYNCIVHISTFCWWMVPSCIDSIPNCIKFSYCIFPVR